MTTMPQAPAGAPEGARNPPLRFALHLGYRPPFEPLFRATVGSDDPTDHLRFAAERGFAGVLDAAARRRPVAQQALIGETLAALGLESGVLLYTTFDQLKNPAWGRDDADARAWIDAEIDAALATAARTGAKRLAIVGGADPDRALPPQRLAMAAHLQRQAGRLPTGYGLCVETLNAASVPGMLLHHLPDAVELLDRVGHPAVRLIFDTAHVQAMDGDVLPLLRDVWPVVGVVQIADHPGRLEPGRGEADLDGVLHWLRAIGHRGLVELEHGWQVPGAEAEAAGLHGLAAHGLAAPPEGRHLPSSA